MADSPAPVVHFEIGCRDSAKSRAFYSSLLGWKFMPYGPAAMIGNVGPMAENKVYVVVFNGCPATEVRESTYIADVPTGG